MGKAEQVYTDLQKHLDKQAVGFPATESGAEIRILKELFDPEQANLALHLSYEPQSAQEISERAKGSGLSLDEVKSMLEAMESNGAIASGEREGKELYYLMPLLVGIVEWHQHKATAQFRADLGEYMSSGFKKAYGSTKVSQMRTIPVEKSVNVEHHITTYDHIREIIGTTNGPIAVAKCMCREGAHKRGQPCHVTSRSETCMAFGGWARHFLKAGEARQVTRDEALEIARQNEADGLVLQPTNNRNVDFICACCGCCCGILNIQKRMPKPAENWAHSFYSSIDTEDCTACGICIDRCQINAITMDEQSGYPVVNLDRCIGCGNCVATCPTGALRLVKVEKETVPPEDCTSLYRILAERRS